MLAVSLDNQLWNMSTKQNKEQVTTRNDKRGISRNEAEEVRYVVEKEIKIPNVGRGLSNSALFLH